MPSGEHEGVLEMVRARPEVVAGLLNVLGVEVPAHVTARSEGADATDLVPAECRADAVVLLTDADEMPLLAVVVEMQREADKKKPWSWPVYLTTLRSRHECPAVLLVICPSVGVANWAGTPIPVGHPGFVLEPLVAGPGSIPLVTEVGTASARPWLALLSALTHCRTDHGKRVLGVLADALPSLDPDLAIFYADLALASFRDAMRQHLERLRMSGRYDFQSEFARRYVSRVSAEAQGSSLLTVLAARGLPVAPEVKDRVLSCRDREQLTTWLKQAANAATIDEVFGHSS